ncbi:MAG: hypothetical protein H6934_03515 [Burkholderiaceae bacterium]|nr:hypothetical protein [Burkholderiaceae bacterium]
MDAITGSGRSSRGSAGRTPAQLKCTTWQWPRVKSALASLGYPVDTGTDLVTFLTQKAATDFRWHSGMPYGGDCDALIDAAQEQSSKSGAAQFAARAFGECGDSPIVWRGAGCQVREIRIGPSPLHAGLPYRTFYGNTVSVVEGPRGAVRSTYYAPTGVFYTEFGSRLRWGQYTIGPDGVCEHISVLNVRCVAVKKRGRRLVLAPAIGGRGQSVQRVVAGDGLGIFARARRARGRIRPDGLPVDFGRYPLRRVLPPSHFLSAIDIEALFRGNTLYMTRIADGARFFSYFPDSRTAITYGQIDWRRRWQRRAPGLSCEGEDKGPARPACAYIVRTSAKRYTVVTSANEPVYLIEGVVPGDTEGAVAKASAVAKKLAANQQAALAMIGVAAAVFNARSDVDPGYEARMKRCDQIHYPNSPGGRTSIVGNSLCEKRVNEDWNLAMQEVKERCRPLKTDGEQRKCLEYTKRRYGF